MSSMFGSKESKTEVPAYIEDASKQAIGMANARNEIGYVPYRGPDVAAFNPMQMNAMEGANRMAGSMGLPTAGLTLMTPEDYGNGVWGHSAAPLYDDNMARLQAANPELFDALQKLKEISKMAREGQVAPDGRMMNQNQNPFQPSGFAGDGMGPNLGREGMVGNGNGLFGGYEGIGDMFNGGGPGASGPSRSGGFSDAVGDIAAGFSNDLAGMFGGGKKK